MAVGDILETTLEWQNVDRGDRYNNVFHWYVNIEATDGDNEFSATEAINSKIVDTILPLLNVKCRFRTTLTQRVYPLPRTAGSLHDNGLGTIGAIAGDALPPSCSLVIRKRTNFAGRRYRGRLFCPMLSESDQVNGIWAGANYLALAAAWDNLLAVNLSGALDLECIPVIFPKGGSSASAKIVTSSSSDPVVRSQRRREVGVGI